MPKQTQKKAIWKVSSLPINEAASGKFIQFHYIRISHVSSFPFCFVLLFFFLNRKRNRINLWCFLRLFNQLYRNGIISYFLFQLILLSISANPSDYHYPPTGLIYGQSFLCLSLNASQIDVVGKQLIYNEPQIYESKLPQSLVETFPNIQSLINGKRINNGPYWNEVDLTTLNGDVFKAFAKSSKFSKELYEDWVKFLLMIFYFCFMLTIFNFQILFSLIRRLHRHWIPICMWKHGARALAISRQTAQKQHGTEFSEASLFHYYF